MGDTVILWVNRRRRGCGSVREEPLRAEVTVASSVELPTTGVAEVTDVKVISSTRRQSAFSDPERRTWLLEPGSTKRNQHTGQPAVASQAAMQRNHRSPDHGLESLGSFFSFCLF